MKNQKTDNSEHIDLSRRKALSRLGLAATAIYAAPVLMTLSQSAQASDAPSAPSTSSPSTSSPSVSAPSVSEPSVSAPSASAPSAPSS